MSSDSIHSRSNTLLCVLMVLVVVGLVGRGLYSLHHGIKYLSQFQC